MNNMFGSGLELQSSIGSILNVVSDLSSMGSSLSGLDTNSNSSISIPGLYNNQSLQMLFSPLLDKTIDKLLDLFITGDIDKLMGGLSSVTNMLGNNGIGRGNYNTEIGQRIIRTVEGSMGSMKYNMTKNKLKKALIIVNNMKKQSKYIKDPVMRDKYNETVSALISLTKFILSIYKNRKLVSSKVLNGLQNLVVENEEVNMKVEKITY